MEDGITWNCSWNVIAYERNEFNVLWHVMMDVERNGALAWKGEKNEWSEMHLSSWERTCNLFVKKKNEKASKQPTKTSTKQTNTFCLGLKHVNKQVALVGWIFYNQ